LRAVTRRASLTTTAPQSKNEEYEINDIYISAATREVLQNRQTVMLTALEFDLLLCLARSKGRVLDRDKLLDEISGRSYDVFDRSIDVHISSLRRKLGDDPKNPRYIKTIRSVGYMLVPNAND
jgi:two-component system response regulator CpxR